MEDGGWNHWLPRAWEIPRSLRAIGVLLCREGRPFAMQSPGLFTGCEDSGRTVNQKEQTEKFLFRFFCLKIFLSAFRIGCEEFSSGISRIRLIRAIRVIRGLFGFLFAAVRLSIAPPPPNALAPEAESHENGRMNLAQLKLKLTAVFEPAREGGYTCHFEELPDVFSEGETLAEAKTNLLDALTQVMEYHREEARKNPSPDAVRKEVQLAVS
jgi:predicted RNase H-like HicB family nuclease